MICDRVQAEISETLDEGGTLSTRAGRHLSGCACCEAFRADSIGLADRYAREVRAGIERLRGAETVAPRRWRPALLGAALAAACLLGWGWTLVRPPVPAAVPTARPAPAPASRVRLFEAPELFDREEVSFLFERDALPVHLDQDLLPERQDLSEIRLPPSLRF